MLAAEVAVLEVGRILQTGSPSELYVRPLDGRAHRCRFVPVHSGPSE